MPLLPISENNYSKQSEMNHITVKRVKSTMGFRFRVQRLKFVTVKHFKSSTLNVEP